MHKPLAVPARKVLSYKRTKNRQGKSVWQFVLSHVRRVTIELVNLLLNHDWVFWLIGMINRKVRLIESVFLAYPATEEYAMAYTYKVRATRIKWDPWPIGFFFQNGKVGVKFAISATNGNFADDANRDDLKRMVERMERIRQLFHADHKTFAGILPGVLFLKRMVRQTPEADVTAAVIGQVIEKVRAKEGMDKDTPVIVLGGRGFIGRRVVKDLPKNNCYCVDIADGGGRNEWPTHLYGKPAILVNITLRSVLAKYIHLFWPELVIINEVYPEPTPELLHQIEAVGSHCYHIVGVKAKAFPSFPGGYEGGIPCCAAWQSNKMEALYKRLA